MNGEVLIVESVSKHYLSSRRKNVLEGIDMKVFAGSCVCIVGENGTGKSTLLKVVAGLIPKNHGKIFLSGKIGYVPEVSINIPSLTARENMEFYNSVSGNKHIDTETFDEFNIPLDGKSLRHFSKGMKRKFDIARALSSNPALLILDEPFEGLDPISCNEMVRVLLKEKENGRAILMSSHDMAYVERISDKIFLLKNGTMRELNEWKNKRVTLFVVGDEMEILKAVGNIDCRISSDGELIKVNVPLDDSSRIMKIIFACGGEVVRQEITSLEEIYLEKAKH